MSRANLRAGPALIGFLFLTALSACSPNRLSSGTEVGPTSGSTSRPVSSGPPSYCSIAQTSLDALRLTSGPSSGKLNAANLAEIKTLETDLARLAANANTPLAQPALRAKVDLAKLVVLAQQPRRLTHKSLKMARDLAADYAVSTHQLVSGIQSTCLK
jgi:predicted protein tyrosine phosphatase